MRTKTTKQPAHDSQAQEVTPPGGVADEQAQENVRNSAHLPEAGNEQTSGVNPASEIVSAFLNLLETIDKHVGTAVFDDEGPYQLMSLPEHLWSVLLGDTGRTVLSARRDSLRVLLADLEQSQ